MLTEKEEDALRRIIEFEDKLAPNAFEEGGTYSIGWSWSDARVNASVLNNLVVKGCIDNVFKSNSYTGYRLREEGREILKLISTTDIEQEYYDTEIEIPEDIFDTIEGYDEVKELFLKSFEGKPVDFLMIGLPGSAKTMFLSELERIKGAVPTVLGGTASKVGIIDILFDYRPKVLLIDEFEHINTRDYTILLSLCETRVISETKHGKQRRMELPDTRMFTGCNSTYAIPDAILDRLQKVLFKPYTHYEFIKIVTNVLVKREGVEGTLADYIATSAWEISHSVRQAIRVAKLAKSIKEVDNLVNIMQKYSV